ncbi:MAG: glycosyltransferase family 1 protein [Gemmatimonadaceae bacterium]
MRVRVIADMLEEKWPSMDLFADMLVDYLPQCSVPVNVELFRLPLKRRLARIFGTRSTTIDRLVGRHFDYPRELRRRGPSGDIDHIVDQTYAASALSLRAERTVITCHDLDAFSPLNASAPRVGDRMLSALATRTLSGLRLAAHVVCDAETVKNELVIRGWVPAERISVIPAGVHPSFSNRAESSGDGNIARLLGTPDGPEMLHVGSTIPRKRIDTLLEALAGVRKHRDDVRLLRAGGAFTDTQRQMMARLGLTGAVITLPFLSRLDLAALYRRATLVVLPSQSEGFGLPLIEAMACGTPVLASNLDVFREVAGEATAYAAVGDSRDWTRAMLAMLDERERSPDSWGDRIARGRQHSRQFSWQEHARRLSQVYDTVLSR